MKKLLITALATVSFMSMAQNAAQPTRPQPGIRPGRGLTPPGLRANTNMNATFPEITGAHVLFVSSSDKVGTNVLNRARDGLMMMLRMPIKAEVRAFEGCAVEYAEKVLGETNVAAVVVVKDDPRAPSLVSFPEKKIVVINPLAYCPEGTSGELIEARMNKMLQRGFCAVMGATLAPVFSVEDLDALKGGVAPSVLSSVYRYGKALGIERVNPISIGETPPDKGEGASKSSATNSPAAK